MKLIQLIKESITLPVHFGVTEAAEQDRNELILQSSQLKLCTNIPEANSVGEASRDIRTFTKAVRDMGLGLRRPLTAALGKIKQVEDDYCAPLEQEQARLERLATDFAQAERRRVAEEERIRREEIARLELERIAAEQKAREEQARLEREQREAEERAQREMAAAKNKKQREAAQAAEELRKAESARQQAIVAEAVKKAQESAEKSQAAMRAPVPENHKIGGMATKRVMDYEVTDLKKVYAVRPELCNLEIKPAAVRAVCVPKFLPASDEVDETSVPGLKLWWTDSTSTRKW